MANSSALSNLVWAEDGLFPLCVIQHNYVECLVDPFAGYLLFLSRTLALPVSWFPLDSWALVTNVVAAAAIGGLAACIAWILVRSGWSRPIAFVASMIPVAIPISGFEAVNASGSAYMMLLIVASLLVCLPAMRLFNRWFVAAVLLVTALTIPSSFVLFAPLLFNSVALARDWKRFFVSAGALTLGLAAQVFVVLTAENPRPITVGVASLDGWVQGLPTALRTLWPGDITLGPTGVLEGNPNPLPTSGWVLLFALLVVALVAIVVGTRSREPRANGLGLLLMTGLLLGAIPAIAGFANNRYYVIPVTILAMCGVLLLGIVARTRQLIAALVATAVLVASWAWGFPAGQYRAQAAPPWDQMLDGVRAQCSSGVSEAPLVFTPNWPFVDAIFPGPTSQFVDCRFLVK